MTLEEQNKSASLFFEECIGILKCKGRDYTPDNKAFNEVVKTANEIGISPEAVLWVYMRKHISAVHQFIRSGRTESESIHSRLTDIANYAALMDVYLQTRPQQTPKLPD